LPRENLNLSVKSKKIDIINGMMNFLKTGEKINLAKYQATSVPKDRSKLILSPDVLMLKWEYKNNLKTRLF